MIANASSNPACPAIKIAGISITPCGISQPSKNFVSPA